jgi:hypothetical protein
MLLSSAYGVDNVTRCETAINPQATVKSLITVEFDRSPQLVFK